jgi:hypothetical protein
MVGSGWELQDAGSRKLGTFAAMHCAHATNNRSFTMSGGYAMHCAMVKTMAEHKNENTTKHGVFLHVVRQEMVQH